MFRQACGILVLISLAAAVNSPAFAQTAETTTPATAYQHKGNWVGYVPLHLRHAQAEAPSPFGVKVPSISESLSARQPAPAAVEAEPVEVESPSLEDVEPDVLTVAYEDGEVIEPLLDAAPLLNEAYDQPLMDDPSMAYDSAGCCGSEPCGNACCEPVCATPWIWGRAEYLLWWTQGLNTPALVTTSLEGTGRPQAGILGEPTTRILFGGEGLNSNSRSGGRFTLGTWLEPYRCEGLEVTYLTLGKQTDSFYGTSSEYPILARPFYNITTGSEDARLIAYDDFVTGQLGVSATTEVQGMEILLTHNASRRALTDIDFLLGYRWAQLKDDLAFRELTESLSGSTEGVRFDVTDHFGSRNNFHGGQFGMRLRRQVAPCWSVELLAKLALGSMNSKATISGQTVTTDVTDGSTESEGGLLAQSTNIGTYDRDAFATVSEIGLQLRRDFDCGVHATFGYTFLHLSQVARAGDLIDRNLSQFPPGALDGAAQPEFSFITTGFWAQGLHFGLEYNY